MVACEVDPDGLRMQAEVVHFPAFLRPRTWIFSTTDQMWIPLDVVFLSLLNFYCVSPYVQDT